MCCVVHNHTAGYVLLASDQLYPGSEGMLNVWHGNALPIIVEVVCRCATALLAQAC